MSRTPAAVFPVSLIAAVVLLGSVGPLATDMYLPAFPQVIDDLGTTPGLVNVTLSTFFLGMALGQLVGGRFSDMVGRRRPLIAGTLVLLLASVICALAPSIEVLIAARLLQGFSGGWSMVIGRAVLVDLARGHQLVRIMNIVMAVGGIAPLIAPLLGALILSVSSWHYSFWAIAVIAAVQVYFALRVVPESLPPERRHSGGLGEFARTAARILRNRAYTGFMLINACLGMAIFAYVSSSPFILQTVNGLTPTQFSLVFAVNSLGIIAGSTTSARLAGRVATATLLRFGLGLLLAAGAWLLVGTWWFDTPLWVAWPSFFALTTSIGFIGGNAAALASAQVPEHAGTASALMGLAQSTAAAIAPMVIALMGADSAWPPGVLILLAPVAGIVLLQKVALPAHRRLEAAT